MEKVQIPTCTSNAVHVVGVWLCAQQIVSNSQDVGMHRIMSHLCAYKLCYGGAAFNQSAMMFKMMFRVDGVVKPKLVAACSARSSVSFHHCLPCGLSAVAWRAAARWFLNRGGGADR